MLLIQVSTGSECDEAGERTGRSGSSRLSHHVLNRSPFTAWSFLGPVCSCPLPVSAKATQVNPDLWFSGESQSLLANVPRKASRRGLSVVLGLFGGRKGVRDPTPSMSPARGRGLSQDSRVKYNSPDMCCLEEALDYRL